MFLVPRLRIVIHPTWEAKLRYKEGEIKVGAHCVAARDLFLLPVTLRTILPQALPSWRIRLVVSHKVNLIIQDVVPFFRSALTCLHEQVPSILSFGTYLDKVHMKKRI